MKKLKNLMLCMMTVMTFCLLFSNVLTVSAATEKTPGNVYVEPYTDAKGNWKDTKKLRIRTLSRVSFDVEYASGDKITNLKVKKSGGLTAAVTYQYDSGYKDGEATISLYATKAGTYTVSFNVVNSQGVKRKSCSLKVQAVNADSVIKKATFGKQTVISNSASLKNGTLKTSSTNNQKVSGKSGKLKITPNSQYKITGIVVVSVGSDGKYSYKKLKNGKNISLSKTYETVKQSTLDGTLHSAKKNTYIYVSYKDKFLGDTCTYSVSKTHGIKEVKCVYKNGQTGKKSTSYSRRPSADITLWQY